MAGVGALLLSVAICFAPPAKAQDVLQPLEDSAKEIISRAEAAGDAVMKSLGEQLLMAIEALRVSAKDVIETGAGAFSAQQMDVFNNLKQALDLVEEQKEAVVEDANRLTASIAGKVAGFPFTDVRPDVMMYRPRVLLPDGAVDAVPIRIIGPLLAASDPTLDHDGVTIALDRSSDTELNGVLTREDFAFDPEQPLYTSVSLALEYSTSSWYLPWTWFSSDTVERDLTLMLLPVRLGDYRISTEIASYERKAYAPLVAHRGKNEVIKARVEPIPAEYSAGWRIDTDAVLSGGVTVAIEKQAGNAACTGVLTPSVSAAGFDFEISVSDNSGNKDAEIFCRLSVPLIRQTSNQPGQVLEGDLGWIESVPVGIPPGTLAYTVDLGLYTGQRETVGKGETSPFPLVEISTEESRVVFRPRPPSDF